MAQAAAGVLGAIVNAASGPQVVEKEKVVVIRESVPQPVRQRETYVDPAPFQHDSSRNIPITPEKVAVAPTQPLFYALQRDGTD